MINFRGAVIIDPGGIRALQRKILSSFNSILQLNTRQDSKCETAIKLRRLRESCGVKPEFQTLTIRRPVPYASTSEW